MKMKKEKWVWKDESYHFETLHYRAMYYDEKYIDKLKRRMRENMSLEFCKLREYFGIVTIHAPEFIKVIDDEYYLPIEYLEIRQLFVRTPLENPPKDIGYHRCTKCNVLMYHKIGEEPQKICEVCLREDIDLQF